MGSRKRIIAWLPVGWYASTSVIVLDKGRQDLLQSLHECLYLSGLITTVGVVEDTGMGAARYASMTSSGGPSAMWVCPINSCVGIVI